MNKNIKHLFLFATLAVLLVGLTAISAADVSDNTTADSSVSHVTAQNTGNVESVQSTDNKKVQSSKASIDKKQEIKENKINTNKNKINTQNKSIKREAKTYVVNKSTVYDIFNGENDGLNASIQAGDILDIQGNISLYDKDLLLNKPVNVISSTNDSYIDLHSGSSPLGAKVGGTWKPVRSFSIDNGGSYTNVTGITFNETQIWVYNASHVTFDNVKVFGNGTLGANIGSFALRTYTSYFTLKNSYLYKEHSESSILVFTDASNCLIENTTIIANSTGNVVYWNTYNRDINTPHAYNNNNTLKNCTIRSTSAGGTSQIIMVGAANTTTIVGNKIYAPGNGITGSVIQSQGEAFLTTIMNNDLYDSAGIMMKGAMIVNNTIHGDGDLRIQANTTYINNNVPYVTFYTGDNVVFVNNTVRENTGFKANNFTLSNNTFNNMEISLSYSNMSAIISNNNFTGTVTIKSNNVLFDKNNITSKYDMALVVTGKNNTISNNYISTLTSNSEFISIANNNTYINNTQPKVIKVDKSFESLKDEWDKIQNTESETEYINVENGEYLFSEELVLNNSSTVKQIIINGGDVDKTIFNGQGLSRLFNLNSSGLIIRFNNITFINGFNNSMGGAIYNNATLNISNCKFINNTVTSHTCDVYGGVIYTLGNAYIYNSSFISNTAHINSSEYGYRAYGGAICGSDKESSTLIVKHCDFIANQGYGDNINNRYNGYGGAIYTTDNSNSNITYSSFIGNQAIYDGGAIYINLLHKHNNTPIINHNYFVNNTVRGNYSDLTHTPKLVYGGFLNYQATALGENKVILLVNNKLPDITVNQKTKKLTIKMIGELGFEDLSLDCIGNYYEANITSSSNLINTTNLKLSSSNNYTVTIDISKLPANHKDITLYVDNKKSVLIRWDYTNVEFNNITAKPGDNITLKAKFTTSTGELVPDGFVAFKINGKTINHTNIELGRAAINYTIPDSFSVKNYTLTVTYGGNNKFIGTKTNASLILSKYDIDMRLDDVNATPGENVLLKAYLTSPDNIPINSGKVVFKLNGKSLKYDNGTTITARVHNGTAQLNYTIPSNYSAKNYTLSAVSVGNNYNRVESASNITLSKIDTYINISNITVNNNNLKINATINNMKTGNVASERSNKVSVKLDKHTVIREVTIKNGIINLNTTVNTRNGVHTVEIVTSGNNIYNSARQNTTVQKSNTKQSIKKETSTTNNTYILSDITYNQYFDENGYITLNTDEIYFLVNGSVINKNINLNNNKTITITYYNNSILYNTTITATGATSLTVTNLTIINNNNKPAIILNNVSGTSIKNNNITTNTNAIEAVNATSVSILNNNITANSTNNITTILVKNVNMRIYDNNINTSGLATQMINNHASTTSMEILNSIIDIKSNNITTTYNNINGTNDTIISVNLINSEIDQDSRPVLSLNNIYTYGNSNAIGINYVNKKVDITHSNIVTEAKINATGIKFMSCQSYQYYKKNWGNPTLTITGLEYVNFKSNSPGCQIVLIECHDMKINNNNITNTTKAIITYNTRNTNITNNKINTQLTAIELVNSTRTNITGNTINTRDNYTITISNSSINNVISNNILYARNEISDDTVEILNNVNRVRLNNPSNTKTHFYLRDDTYNVYFDENGMLKNEVPIGMTIRLTEDLHDKTLNIIHPINILSENTAYVNCTMIIDENATGTNITGALFTGENTKIVVNSNNSNLDIVNITITNTKINNQTSLIINGNNNNIIVEDKIEISNTNSLTNITVITVNGSNNHINSDIRGSEANNLTGVILNNANNNTITGTTTTLSSNIFNPIILINSNYNNLSINASISSINIFNRIQMYNSSYNNIYYPYILNCNVKDNIQEVYMNNSNNNYFEQFTAHRNEGKVMQNTPFILENSNNNTFYKCDLQYSQYTGYIMEIRKSTGNLIEYNQLLTKNHKGNDTILQENNTTSTDNIIRYNYAKQGKSVTFTVNATNTIKVHDTLTITSNAEYKKSYRLPGVPLQGEVIYKINGITIKTINITKGISSINYTVTGNEEPTLTIEVTYRDPTQEYRLTSRTVTCNVEKLNTNIFVGNVTNNGCDATLTAIVTDENKNIVKNGSVVFKVNDENVGKTSIENGAAILTVDASKYNTGSHNITAKLVENNIYNSANDNATLTINKYNATMTIEEINAKPGETVTFRVYLTDNNDNPINSGKVIFKLNGKTLKDANGSTITVRVHNGIALLNYTIPAGYSAKNYTLTAVSVGNTYNRVEASTNITLTKINTYIQNVNTYFTGNTLHVRANIISSTTQKNTAYRETKVTVKINNKTFAKEVKVTNGSIDLNIDTSSIGQGQYKITIKAGENGIYTGSQLDTYTYKQAVKSALNQTSSNGTLVKA